LLIGASGAVTGPSEKSGHDPGPYVGPVIVRATNVRGSDQIRRLQNWVSERESRRVPGARFLLQRSSPPLPSRSLIGLGADEVATTSRSARRRSASRSAALRLIRSRNGHRTSRDRSAPPWSGNRDSTQADRGRSAAAGTIRLEKGFQCSLWVRHCPTLPDARDPRRSSFALRGDAWGLAIGGEFGSANASMPNDGSHFSTGIDTDRKSLKRIPYARIAVHCPYCGREHTWGRGSPLWRKASC
jgi:hypothetical protein